MNTSFGTCRARWAIADERKDGNKANIILFMNGDAYVPGFEFTNEDNANLYEAVMSLREMFSGNAMSFTVQPSEDSEASETFTYGCNVSYVR